MLGEARTNQSSCLHSTSQRLQQRERRADREARAQTLCIVIITRMRPESEKTHTLSSWARGWGDLLLRRPGRIGGASKRTRDDDGEVAFELPSAKKVVSPYFATDPIQIPQRSLADPAPQIPYDTCSGICRSLSNPCHVFSSIVNCN